MNVDPKWAAAMRRGDYASAWAMEAQAHAKRDPQGADNAALPYHLRWVWNGTPLDGRHVLVRCYHGLGDTLQFARYLPHLAERAASVTLETPARLHDLLSQFPCRLIDFDPARPAQGADCAIEIMELAFALRMPPESAAGAWLQAEGFRLPAGTIGLCFEAGDWDGDRRVAPEWLTATPLQRPCIALDLGRSPLAVLNPGGCPADLAATAALVAGCEAVVTVDTMIAHLAGSMGKPTWLMLRHDPDWRWVPGAETSAWYPSLRLVHQATPGDWAPVVAQVRAELDL